MFNNTRCGAGLMALLLITLSACAPSTFKRSTVSLSHPNLDQFEIRHADFQGCLWRHPVPVHYRIQRTEYELEVDVRFGLGAEPASLDITVRSQPAARAEFLNLPQQPDAQAVDKGHRYRLLRSQIAQQRLALDVFSEGRALGRERFRLDDHSCLGLSLE
ncbi:MAG: hypothetical protein ACPGZP_00435 [Panacagrimonas sp.]